MSEASERQKEMQGDRPEGTRRRVGRRDNVIMAKR
jgi:hypothetical protein